jgi:hypothetical protein
VEVSIVKTLRFTLLLICLLLVGVAAKAQTHVTASTTIFDDEGLGYNLPVVRFGLGVEQPIGRHFEVDGFGSYAISHKAVLNNGHTVLVSVTPIVWATSWFGVTGDVRYSHLTTSAYSKGTYLPSSISGIPASLGSFIVAPGIIFRVKPAGLPSRLWIDGVIPTGRINAATGIESNRLSGVEIKWEADMYDVGPFSIRGVINPSFYHGYSQGNPVCDGTNGGSITCPRVGWTTYTIGLGVKFVFPRDKNF